MMMENWGQHQRPPAFDPAQLQAVIEQIRLQRQQFQPNPIAEAFTGLIKVAAVTAVVGLGFAGVVSLFSEDDKLRDRARHQRARNRRLNGKRVRLSVEKTGFCTCCNKTFRYTEVHHYAGRAVPVGREMCAPCHFHCGHNGDWYNAAVNPRYCRIR